MSEMVRAFANHRCSLEELARRDPDQFAHITKFLLFAHEEGGSVVGGPPEMNEFVATHFGVEIAQNCPRVVDNRLYYLIRFTAPDEGWFIRPVLPHEVRVFSVVVDLTTGNASSSEIPRVHD